MIRPILKWPGGKSRLMPELLQHLPKADCLIEPFVGGASVFLNTEYRRYILADINPDLICLYREVKNSPEMVIEAARKLFKTGNSSELYLCNRKTFNTERGYPSVMRAALFLYLNRHCFNGVVRYNQSGAFNTPFGQHKSAPYFPEKEIRQFSEKANDTRAIFLCCSFENTLKVMPARGAAIYCDPPYLPVSETASFTQYHSGPFTDKQHRQLAATLLEANQKYSVPVVISNSDTATTHEIYQHYHLNEITAPRSVAASGAASKTAKEVIGTLGIVGGCPAGSCGHCESRRRCHVIDNEEVYQGGECERY